MRIIVVGCGKIGQTILQSLVAEKHEIVAIDNDPAIIREITNNYDVMCLCGNGTECEMLREANAAKTDLFIAVTGSDELNMLSCFAAKRLGAKYTVARIRNLENNNESLAFMTEQLDISMAINPELKMAHEICNLLKLPSATKAVTFGSHGFEMIELPLKADSPLDGMSLIDLRKKLKANFLICTISRNGEVYIPKGNFCLKSGDRVGLIASEEDTHKLIKMMGIQQKPVKSAMIMGASKSSHYLTELLLKNNISVKVIDLDSEKCADFCEDFPSIEVVCGDGMNQELLMEEGIQATDAFVAMTGKDEENILISFYCMSHKVPKIISKVNRNELSAIAEKLGLECTVSTKKTTADIVVRYARALQSSIGSKMETLYSLMNGKAEAVEFIVMDDFKYTGKPLKEMKFRSDVLLAGIIRGKKAIIPAGDDTIEPEDRVIVISTNHVYSLSEIIDR